jgi:cyanocobalamin reductase (cyanide-eliminating) / alkylcobalamin dealkylase
MLAGVSRAPWQDIAERFAGHCAEAGLDLSWPFNVRKYNLQAFENERLFDFGRPDALGILVGNTRRLWPVFKRALAAETALSADPNPLDSYVTARLRALGAGVLGRPFQLIFAHATAPKPFPIQRLAEAVDFAATSPSHLSIHPEHGPWLALRAVVVVDVEGPAPTPGRLESPCRGCSAPCVPALRRAIAVSTPPLSEQTIAEHAAEWIAIRDACPVGRGSRYGEEQLVYHYTKNPLSPPCE